MNIQINTDNHIKSNVALIKKFSSAVESGLSRMSDHITHVAVHLSEDNGNKKKINEKSCMIEVRLKGLQPVVVTEHAVTLNYALNGAIYKLVSKIESILGRQRDKNIKNK